MSVQVRDPYTVLIKEKKLPMSLLEDPEKKQQASRCLPAPTLPVALC